MNPTLDQAIAHHKAGRLAEAEAIYRRLLTRNDRDAGALQMLGMLYLQGRRNADAAALLRKAAAVNPNSPQVCLLHAQAARLTNNFAEGQSAASRAIALRPAHPAGYNELGLALVHLDRPTEAIQSFRRAIERKPDYADAHSNLGAILAQRKEFTQAIEVLQHALALSPNNAGAHNNLANALSESGQIDQAIPYWQRALELQPNLFDALINLAKALQNPSHHAEAESLIDRALALKPGDPTARFLHGLMLLERGELRGGFADYEYRLKCTDFDVKSRTLPQPKWDGSDPAGKTILLHAEQGLGDTIQFVRYAPLLNAQGTTVLLESPPQLSRLLATVPGVDQLISRGDPLPPFDVHASVVSLPLLFGTELATIPASIPYLFVAPDLIARWERILAPPAGARRIGLVWAGNPSHTNDKNRSIPLGELAPLAAVKGATFYSLQKGPAAQDVSTSSLGFNLINHAASLQDFADTAAIISQLDLVITVDTSVAHLARALGKPVWTLLPYAADWRWMLAGERSPWYPTMRLFRQSSPEGWRAVVANVVAALEVKT